MEQQLEILYAAIKNLGDVDKGIVLLFLEGRKYEDILTKPITLAKTKELASQIKK